MLEVLEVLGFAFGSTQPTHHRLLGFAFGLNPAYITVGWVEPQAKPNKHRHITRYA